MRAKTRDAMPPHVKKLIESPTNLMLNEDTRDGLRELGDGNITEGLRRAVRLMRRLGYLSKRK
jgi:hypothetical protein